MGRVIAGRYKLERQLGEGGMGTVFLATHVGLGTSVAVKLLRPELVGSGEAAVRLVREAAIGARLTHPNIVRVLDVGQDDDGAPFLVMDALEGESLADRLAKGFPLDARAAVVIMVEVLRGLEIAHAAGVIHRDIKPSNVFLVRGADGATDVKVLDFGVAKLLSPEATTLTMTGASLGSPLYMSPEQVRGDSDIDARTDVWSVGVTLYEAIAGKAPHAAPTVPAAIARILTEAAAPLSSVVAAIDSQIDGIIARALSIPRADRFASAEEMDRALQRWLDGQGETVLASPSSRHPSGVPSTARSAQIASAPPQEKGGRVEGRFAFSFGGRKFGFAFTFGLTALLAMLLVKSGVVHRSINDTDTATVDADVVPANSTPAASPVPVYVPPAVASSPVRPSPMRDDPNDRDSRAPPSARYPDPTDAPPSTYGGGATTPFDRGAASAALKAASDSAGRCLSRSGPTGSGRAAVTFSSAGVVTAVVLDPPFARTDAERCIAHEFRSARVPPFEGAPVTVKKTFVLGDAPRLDNPSTRD